MEQLKNEIHISDRKYITITGIQDIINFDEHQIELLSGSDELVIQGSGLHVQKFSLDTEDVVITGLITSLFYAEEVSKKSSGLFSRIFG